MRERSQTLEATFNIAPREPQGTRVSVRFAHKPLSQYPETHP
jgi:two-component system nitrate/nitrite sensor histidine kinase NarX